VVAILHKYMAILGTKGQGWRAIPILSVNAGVNKVVMARTQSG